MPASYSPVNLRFLLFLLIVPGLFSLHYPARGEGFHDDLEKGRQFNLEEAELLEEKLKNNPHDVSSRTQLLGYYMQLPPVNDPSVLEAKRKHILWLVQNSPEAEVLGALEVTIIGIFDPIGYSKVKEAWRTQLERNPKNVTILGNAAKMLGNPANAMALNERESAIKLLQRAQSLDPSNAKWATELGHQYAMEALWNALETPWGSPEAVKVANDRALTQFENAYALEDEHGKDALLPDLAKAAFGADQLVKARKYAENTLQVSKSDWDYGNRIHHGNLVLGRIALREDNIDEAKTRLIAAGNTPGSPQLDSVGPTMTLAKELLERGERDIVLEYFRLCSKFWASEDAQDQLDKWAVLVNGGRVPDFGANLHY